MTDKREFIKLDIGYLSNPKIAGLLVDRRPNAVLLHVYCMTYSRQHRTDGVVPTALALRGVIGATKRDVTACVDAGLLVDRGGGAVEVHDYLEHQESAEQIEARSDAGRTAAAARWRNADRTADGNANRMRSAMQRRGEERREEPPASLPPLAAADAPAVAGAETTSAKSRGTRIPDPFVVTPEMVGWARENTPGIDHRAVTAAFEDYWRALPGAKGVKLDWVATWRNWLRREAESPRAQRPADRPRPGASVWDKRVGEPA